MVFCIYQGSLIESLSLFAGPVVFFKTRLALDGWPSSLQCFVFYWAESRRRGVRGDRTLVRDGKKNGRYY